jgi:hypothetical protein
MAGFPSELAFFRAFGVAYRCLDARGLADKW